MVWIDAADRRFRVRHAARLEVWAAREHARIARMADEARAAFAPPASVSDGAFNAQQVVTTDMWRMAVSGYANLGLGLGYPFDAMFGNAGLGIFTCPQCGQ